MVDYGFSGLNQNLNPNKYNNFNTNTALNSSNLIIAVRVLRIILDETHPRFEELGGWNSLGTIECEPVLNPFPRPLDFNSNAIIIASPVNPNIKNYPLVNEIVNLISLPNTGIGESNTSQKFYYINNIALWNHPHHNAYPENPNTPAPSQQKDYIETQIGSVRRVIDQSTEIFLGKTFYERPNIHPLLPFEGDFIQEGRWGNSIRLGSTVGSTPNNWSNSGINGDPITIIRNGQGNQTEEGWIPITENINNDDSSIYLTSTQQIPLKPLKPSSTLYLSYSGSGYTPPTSPNEFDGNQIILSSGRLVFNSKNDHILLSSAKSINLNSQESVNIDTDKFIVRANNTYFGNETLATEPLLLGNTTVQLLTDLIDALKTLSSALTSAQTSPTILGTPSSLPSLNLAATTFTATLNSLNTQLNNLTSKTNFTA